MSDKRKHPRKAISLNVTFEVDGIRQEGESKDISIGGMFVTTAVPAKFQANVVVEVQFPDQKDKSKIAGIVRWMKPEGMGVQFGPVGAKDTHSLTELLKDRARSL